MPLAIKIAADKCLAFDHAESRDRPSLDAVEGVPERAEIARGESGLCEGGFLPVTT